MTPCADCGTVIPRRTPCWLVHLPPTLEDRVRTKTICMACHDAKESAA